MDAIYLIIIAVFIVIGVYLKTKNDSEILPESGERRLMLINKYREAIKVGDKVMALDAFIDLFDELMKNENIANLQKENIAKGFAKELSAIKSELSINDILFSNDFPKEKIRILTQIQELGLLKEDESIFQKNENINESKFIPKRKPVRKS